MNHEELNARAIALDYAVRQYTGRVSTPEEITSCAETFYQFLTQQPEVPA